MKSASRRWRSILVVLSLVGLFATSIAAGQGQSKTGPSRCRNGSAQIRAVPTTTPQRTPETTELFRVPEWDYSHNMAAGNMIATAEDLARFGYALVRPGFLTRASYDLLYTRPKTEKAESPMSFGWFVRETSAGPRRIHITGSNPGVQAGLYVYPDSDLVLVVLSNSWGVGSRSGELVGGQSGDLAERIAVICGQNPQRR